MIFISNIDYRDNNRWKVYVHIIPKDITNYKNDKYYVGITCKKNCEQRWYLNGTGYRRNVHFYNAIEKYGWGNIIHEIIAENLTHNEANMLEKALIRELKSNNSEYGYNHSVGGDGGNQKQTRRVRQYSKDGTYITTYNSMADAGRSVGVDRNNIMAACKYHRMSGGYMWCYDNEEISNPYKIKAQKNIVCIDFYGNYINTFNSIKETSEYFNISSSSILSCCKHKNNSCYKYIMFYEEEYNQLSDSDIKKYCDKASESYYRRNGKPILDLENKVIYPSCKSLIDTLKIDTIKFYKMINQENRYIYLHDYVKNNSLCIEDINKTIY